MAQGFPVVLTVAQAAERLQTSPKVIVAELENDRIRGFKVGDEWRTTEEDLIAIIGIPRTLSGTATARQEPSDTDHVTWREVDPFAHVWPKKKDDPKDPTEP